MAAFIYSILENKIIYDLSQAILAPRGVRNLGRRIAPYLNLDREHAHRALELGCGTGFFSINQPDVRYFGTDVNAAYFPPNPPTEQMSYQVMDASRLDFPDGHFNLVYSVGLYHHVSDETMRASLRESKRVLAPGGRIVLLDNIWPTRAWNIYAWLIRRLDRGDHVRTQEHILNLVRESELAVESIEKFYYTFTGLEAVILQIRK